MLTKDGYQFNVGLILHRLPLLIGYNKDVIKAFKQRFNILQQTAFYNTIPPEFAENLGNPMLEH